MVSGLKTCFGICERMPCKVRSGQFDACTMLSCTHARELAKHVDASKYVVTRAQTHYISHNTLHLKRNRNESRQYDGKNG